MRRVTALALLLLLPTSSVAGEDPAPALQLESTVPLPGVKGRIDHLDWHHEGGFLFVAALANGTVERLERLANGSYAVRTLVKELKEPQGILCVLTLGFRKPVTGGWEKGTVDVVVACGDGTVRFVDGMWGGKQWRRASTGGDADNLRFDGERGRVVVGHGNGALSWIDSHDGSVERMVQLDAHPEGFQIEEKGKRVFVNVPGAGHVAVVDREQKKVVARWETGEAKANYPMALDEERKRLFVGCREPARLLVYDTESEKVLQTLDCVGDADDLFVDRGTGRVLAIGGEGFVDVFSRDEKGIYSRTSRTPTAPGARTGLLEEDRLFVAAPARAGKDAAILVFRLAPPGAAPAGK